VDTTILVELERAELAARERRLTAEVEAARIVADAEQQARQIIAEVPERARRELAARRRRLRTAARREIRIIRELTACEREGQAHDRAIAQAAAIIVSAVLGETTSGGQG
jgi:vacuolar-type H+-ATPase subunit H